MCQLLRTPAAELIRQRARAPASSPTTHAYRYCTPDAITSWSCSPIGRRHRGALKPHLRILDTHETLTFAAALVARLPVRSCALVIDAAWIDLSRAPALAR